MSKVWFITGASGGIGAAVVKAPQSVVYGDFVGSDASSAIAADLAARLRELHANKDLSVSTDGNFEGELT